MPLFPCRGCLAVENTALSNFWHAAVDGWPILCSACDPSIAEWHARFPRKPSTGYLVDQEGHLWTKHQVDAGMLPPTYKIVGEIFAVHDPCILHSDQPCPGPTLGECKCTPEWRTVSP